MNLFLGPIPESSIGARLFEVAFPPRQRRSTDVPRFPLSHVEPKYPIVVQTAGGPLFDWATDERWAS